MSRSNLFPEDGHPELEVLVDLARSAGDSSTRDHVMSCRRCRSTLQLLRKTREALSEEASPPPADLLARILSDRERGNRVSLAERPAAGSGIPGGRGIAGRLALAAACAVLAVVAMLSLPADRAVAGARAGEMTFAPATPGRGALVSVRYEPSGPLAPFDSLTLRTRYRTPDGEAYNEGFDIRTVAVLRRGADGSFTGRFTLPDSVVHAAFSVEAPDGWKTDDNRGRTWTLLVHQAGGPTVEALEQHPYDLMGVSWEEAHAAAMAGLERHPRSPTMVALAQFFERAFVGEAPDDGIEERHRATVAELDRILDGAALGPRELGWMAWITWLADHESAGAWLERLRREAPGTKTWAFFAVQDLRERHGENHAALLRDLEDLWAEWGAPHDNVTEVGVRAARALGDPEALIVWTDRASERRPAEAVAYARALLRDPDLRREGIDRLRELVSELTAYRARDRRLGETVEEQRRRQEAEANRSRARIGFALLEEGEEAEGVRLLEDAARGVWDPAIFRTLARARGELGDAVAAAEMLARVVVDPRTEPSTADSLRAVGRRSLGPPGWSAAVREARTELRTRVLDLSKRDPLPHRVRLEGRDGEPRDLEELAEGRTSVLVFWNRRCGAFLMRLPEIRRVVSRLEEAGIQVLWVTEEPPSEELDAFIREKEMSGTLLYDTRKEGKNALNVWGTPSFHVLDGEGHIRFSRPATTDELLVQARALQTPAPVDE